MVVDPDASAGLAHTPLIACEGLMQSASTEPALGTILLVDDDVDALDSMSECLNIYGYATLRAQNGQIALNLLKKTAAVPSLILLDMSMPVLDGPGFLERRQRRCPSWYTVIIVSGNDAPTFPLVNVKGYLRKPVSMTRLMPIIESTL